MLEQKRGGLFGKQSRVCGQTAEGAQMKLSVKIPAFAIGTIIVSVLITAGVSILKTLPIMKRPAASV